MLDLLLLTLDFVLTIRQFNLSSWDRYPTTFLSLPSVYDVPSWLLTLDSLTSLTHGLAVRSRVADQRLKIPATLPKPRSRVITAHDGRSSFRGGSLLSSRTVGRKNISQAQKLADLDSELAAMLYSRMKEVSIAYQQPNSETDAIQRRKMERMMAVRQLESQEDPKTRKSLLLSHHEQRTQHTRDLQLIEAYRERTKAECISSMLNQAITSNYTVYATLGTAEFFEFQLKNPYNIQYTISIEIDHSDL
ncbi:unnamed protein product, partial [Ranitomeya imitator]